MSRFFHTLVVFGASATLANCGGKTTGERQAADPGGDGATGGGASLASGGVPGSSSGGAAVLGPGGALELGTGGIPVADAAALPPAETLAQWSCGTTGACVSLGAGPMRQPLATPCPIDRTLPRAAADCAPDEWFECLAAAYLGLPVSVTCRCVPMGDAGAECGGCSPDRAWDGPVVCVGHDKLCGCALTRIY